MQTFEPRTELHSEGKKINSFFTALGSTLLCEYVTFRVPPDPEVLPAESRQDKKLIILALNHSRMALDKTRGTNPACMHIFFNMEK